MTEAPFASRAGAEPGAMKVRSFVAVPLPPQVQAQVLDAAKSIGAELPTVKWSRKVENLHVTLTFLGDVAVDHLASLEAGLVEQGTRHRTFPVTVRGFGAFPEARHATTIWAGVEDGGGRLQEIAAVVARVAEGLGLSKPPRSFRPHVTVGRCKRAVDTRRALEPWQSRSFGTFPVTALHVYESQLGRDGSTYVLRGRVPLLQ